MPTHTRIRMFNTKATYPNQTWTTTCARRCAPATLSTCAAVGTDFEGNLVGWVTHERRPSRR